MIAKVVLADIPYSIDRPYDYEIPAELEGSVHPGCRVTVPFSRNDRITEGIVIALREKSDYPDCKSLYTAEAEPVFSSALIQLALFMRERYFCTAYDAFRVMIPAGFWISKSGKRRANDKYTQMAGLLTDPAETMLILEQKRRKAPRQAEILELLSQFEILPVRDLLAFSGSGRESIRKLAAEGIVEIREKEVYRRPDIDAAEKQELPKLSDEQEKVFTEIQNALSPDKPGLLYGVTGSGKTTVYAHLIQNVLAAGRTAILLVPEIALTPQMLRTFTMWFGDKIALMHSGLSAGERYDEWKRIKRGEASLVIGTRSAIFSPCRSLGLIIMDEEQEESYYSESSPRYRARDIARFRALKENAAVLFGSATPDLRSMYHAQKQDYTLFRLSSRYNQNPLPPVHIIDMREELRAGRNTSISMTLHDAILSRMEREEQSILFLNRRGTNQFVTCMECGFVYYCPHCSVAMTWHAKQKRLICHYCGTQRRPHAVCPNCGGELGYVGTGTQKIETELEGMFPGTPIMRVDADSISGSSHRELFNRFISQKIPIMIGTQMIAKGLNFDNVTLVGILSADQSLYMNDYRSGEKSFSLFTQVIGRCGRSKKPGEAYIQTYTPNNEIIRLAARQDYDEFYQSEIRSRSIQDAPPFADWVSIIAVGNEERVIIASLAKIKSRLALEFAGNHQIQINDPAPLPVVRVNDQFRYRLMFSCRMDRFTRRVLSEMLKEFSRDREMRGIYLGIETDPLF